MKSPGGDDGPGVRISAQASPGKGGLYTSRSRSNKGSADAALREGAEEAGIAAADPWALDPLAEQLRRQRRRRLKVAPVPPCDLLQMQRRNSSQQQQEGGAAARPAFYK